MHQTRQASNVSTATKRMRPAASPLSPLPLPSSERRSDAAGLPCLLPTLRSFPPLFLRVPFAAYLCSAAP